MQSTLGRVLSRHAKRSASIRHVLPSAVRHLTASPESNFQYAKAEDLFQRITATCSKEDITQLAHEINKILGREFRTNEFYYTGFGGRRVGGSGGAEGTAETGDAPVAEAKSTVDVKLSAFDAKSKIKVIKEVRAITGLGLKEAKELVESAPATIQKDMKPEAAEELKKKLEEVGATIELA
jgi:ribosomal protein L7/L12